MTSMRSPETDELELGQRCAYYLGGAGRGADSDGRPTLVGAYRDALWRYAYALEMKRIIPILKERLAGLNYVVELAERGELRV